MVYPADAWSFGGIYFFWLYGILWNVQQDRGIQFIVVLQDCAVDEGRAVVLDDAVAGMDMTEDAVCRSDCADAFEKGSAAEMCDVFRFVQYAFRGLV